MRYQWHDKCFRLGGGGGGAAKASSRQSFRPGHTRSRGKIKNTHLQVLIQTTEGASSVLAYEVMIQCFRKKNACSV